MTSIAAFTASATRTSSPAAPIPGPLRSTYDAGSSESPAKGLGKLVRSEGQGPTGDAAVDAAHDNAGIVHDFYAQVLGRNSIDDAGMGITSVVHFGRSYNNAYWDGEKMTYGDGDGRTFSPLSGAVDVVGHEITHGMTEHTAQLTYRGQPGALNESWSDVFGELIEQWSEHKDAFGTVDAAKGADWLIGEDVFTPGTAGDALRSMSRPGTAYKGDPQPADMAHYKRMSDDNGGVHVNSGIPNRAAYETAVRIGSEKLAKIWYTALSKHLTANATFVDAARATVLSATELYGSGTESQAVTDAWTAVGVLGANAVLVPDTDAPDAGSDPADADPDGGIVPKWLRDGTVTAAEQQALQVAS